MNISVVIPMYNREKTIESAIMSVLKQTVLPMEIIVVDDCSTDRSVEIVNKVRIQNQIIRLIRMQKNRGAQAARNCGLKVAKGEWILFLDSDDQLVDNALEVQRTTAEKNPGYDVYYGDYYLKKNGRKRYISCRMKGKDGEYHHSILFSSKVLFSGPLIRKKALENIGLLDEHVPAYQEWDTNIRLSLHHKYYYIDKPIFIYNLHEGTTISKDLQKSVKGFQYVVKSNGALFLADAGIRSIIFYYDGMYWRYKRCHDYRQYYYLCMKKMIHFTSGNEFLEKCYLYLFSQIWKCRIK